jgi:hypothetical protein
MGKVFLALWNAATDDAKEECARLLDMEVDQVEKIMAERTRAIVEKEEQ